MGQFFHLHVDLTWIFELNATDIKTSLFYVLVVFLFVFFFSFFVFFGLLYFCICCYKM